MRTEKELLIASKEYASEDRTKSWYLLLSTLALCVLSLSISLSNLPWGFRLIASGLSGLLIVRLFIFYHDFQHHSCLARSTVARIILDTYGLLVLSPPSVWNRSHDHHHKHNSRDLLSSMGSFPTMTCEQYLTSSFPIRMAYYWARHPLNIAFGYLTIFMGGMCVRALVKNPKLHKDAGVALVLHVLLALTLAWFGWDKLLLGMILPLTIACGTGAFLFYVQHNFPGCILDSREDWSHTGAALKSSSYLKMSPIMNWFTGNIGYHHVHHLNAKIPFYRLPEAMSGMPELRKPASITLRLADIVACFRSNLWDVESKQLISFQAAKLRRQKTRVPSSVPCLILETPAMQSSGVPVSNA